VRKKLGNRQATCNLSEQQAAERTTTSRSPFYRSGTISSNQQIAQPHTLQIHAAAVTPPIYHSTRCLAPVSVSVSKRTEASIQIGCLQNILSPAASPCVQHDRSHRAVHISGRPHLEHNSYHATQWRQRVCLTFPRGIAERPVVCNSASLQTAERRHIGQGIVDGPIIYEFEYD
jgi:hypothetical protein